MTESPSPVPDSRTLIYKWLIPAVALLVIVVYGLNRLLSGPTTGPQNTVQSSDQRAIESEQHELNALAAVKRATAQATADEALALLDDLTVEISTWSTEIAALLENERGRLLASHEGYVLAFDAIHQKERPTLDDVQRYRNELSQLLTPITASIGEPSSYIPDDNLIGELRTRRDSIHASLSAYRTDRQSIEAMITAAEETASPSDQLLNQAIQKLRQEAALERARIILAETQQAEEEAARTEGQAKAEQIRILGDQHAANIRAETARKKRHAQRERLRALAEDPATQKDFKPFLTKGRNIVGYTPARSYDVPSPVSLTALRKRGALKDVQSFAAAGSGQKRPYWTKNDRPLWKYPNTEDEMAEMERRFELFNELADIWVEMGLLQP